MREFPTGIYEKHEGYTREKAEKKKEEIEEELFSLSNTLEIKVLIEDAPAGGFKVVNREHICKVSVLLKPSKKELICSFWLICQFFHLYKILFMYSKKNSSYIFS